MAVKKEIRSAIILMIILAATIMAVEALIMYLIDFLDQLDHGPHSHHPLLKLLDPVILAVILSPLLYYTLIHRIVNNEERLNTIFNTLLEGVALNEMVFNDEGEMVDYRIMEVNESFYKLADFIADGPVVGRLASDIYQMDREFIKTFWKNHKNITETVYSEMVSPISQKVFEIRTSPFIDNKFVTSFHDITEQKKAQELITEKDLLLEETQYVAGLGSYSFDIQNNTTLVTETFRNILGFGPKRPITLKAWAAIVHPDDRKQMWEFLRKGYKGRFDIIEKEYRIIKSSDNQEHWIHNIAKFKKNEQGRLIQMSGTVQDITEKKLTEERIRHLAYFDQLTDLPNRTLMKDRFEYILNLAQRNQQKFALLFIDLDQFKTINDTLGHDIGDELLKKVAKRLKRRLRKEDVLARQGGDEYIVLLPELDIDGAGKVAINLQKILSRPYRIDKHHLTITASIGIALYPADGESIETLMKNADTAMYKAKKSGRNNFYFFTEKMQEMAQRNLAISNALRLAIDHGEFELHYQAQFNAKTKKITGAEALLRWKNPELGVIAPSEFIPIAEDTGQIIKIGTWVLDEAIHQLKVWMNNGFDSMVMAVNISAIQFNMKDLPEEVCNLLDQAGLPHENLELELTEGMMMKDPQEAIQLLAKLHQNGIRISIDDFGTGYSSLNYLKHLRVNKIKIDQSFVKNLTNNLEDKTIVKAIISLAKSLNLQTNAEGVENREQYEILLENGCDEIQGFYFSKPMPAENFRKFIAENQ